MTLSHVWGKLNLPIFLFKVGIFTLNMDSLMFLTKPCPPSLLFEVLLGGGVTCVTTMMIIIIKIYIEIYIAI